MVWPFGPSALAQPSKPSKATAQDEQADQEFAELVRSFQSTGNATQLAAPTPAIGGVAPPVSAPKIETLADGRRVFSDGTIDITPDQMHPRSMNCRQAFDQAFYCQSLGGKFQDIYRFGELKSCSEQWGAFWFCMRTRTLGDGERGRQTVEYYTQRDATRKSEHGSSEDVWDIRTRSVREAFGKDPDAANAEMSVKS